MARPIPTNLAGLRRPRHFDAQVFAPPIGLGRRPARAAREPLPINHRRSTGAALLLISGLVGGLATASALGLWPTTTRLGLDGEGLFYLFATGVYLLATSLYAAWRTRLMEAVGQAPLDARLMAYANVGVGGAVVFTLGVIALAVVALACALIGLAVALLNDGPGRPRG
jgi:hypothetical protein